MPVCSKCKIEKSIKEFGPDRRRVNGLQSHCKPCHTESTKRYYAKNKADRLAYMKEYVKRVKEEVRQGRREKKKYVCDPITREEYAFNARFKLTRVTKEQYLDKLKEQNGVCAICGRGKDTLKKSLCADHCHKTGKFRGLLCSTCNLGIGMLRDDLGLLSAAVEYLKKYS